MLSQKQRRNRNTEVEDLDEEENGGEPEEAAAQPEAPVQPQGNRRKPRNPRMQADVAGAMEVEPSENAAASAPVGLSIDLQTILQAGMLASASGMAAPPSKGSVSSKGSVDSPFFSAAKESEAKEAVHRARLESEKTSLQVRTSRSKNIIFPSRE